MGNAWHNGGQGGLQDLTSTSLGLFSLPVCPLKTCTVFLETMGLNVPVLKVEAGTAKL